MSRWLLGTHEATRMLVVATLGLVGAVGCSEPPADFVVNVDNGAGDDPSLDFDQVVGVEEGQTMDLLVTPSIAGVSVTASQLPENAVFEDGILSFRPDFDQAGVYRVDFSSTIEGQTVSHALGIRVLNVIHVPPTGALRIDEGGTTTVALASHDPPGTLVTYRSSLDDAPIPGAAFDPRTGTLTLSPGVAYLDTRPASTTLTVTAEGTELDSGVLHVATREVSFEVVEQTAYAQEIQAEIFDAKCSFPGGCHGGATPSAGLNLTAGVSFAAIVGTPPMGPSCGGGTATETALIVPGMPDQSLLYHKMIGEQSCGLRMPNNCDTGGSIPCASPSENRKVRLWIEAGAPEN